MAEAVSADDITEDTDDPYETAINAEYEQAWRTVQFITEEDELETTSDEEQVTSDVRLNFPMKK